MNVGSDSGGDIRSGTAGNEIVNVPSASVIEFPRAMRRVPLSNGSHGKYHRHHIGNRTSRFTLQTTFAPPTAKPVYVEVVPESVTFFLSCTASVGVASSTLNLGRLYSSTRTPVTPVAPLPCARTDHLPGSDPVGIGKVP